MGFYATNKVVITRDHTNRTIVVICYDEVIGPQTKVFQFTEIDEAFEYAKYYFIAKDM